jgi:hypothetical protein
MDPERWRRAFTLFHEVIARDAGERESFLAAACLGDDGVRWAAEQLASAHESAGDFLEVPAAIRFLADGGARSDPARVDAFEEGRVAPIRSRDSDRSSCDDRCPPSYPPAPAKRADR